MAAGQRMFEVLDVDIEVEDKPDAIDIEGHRRLDRVQDVTFGYVTNQPVLRHITLPGRSRARPSRWSARPDRARPASPRWCTASTMSGRARSSSAATTCATSPRIRSGRQMAMVLQEPFLFSGTILENIRYAKAGATRDDVIAAAKAVGAHDFIMRLPRGYETELDQRGANLSLGQRQLLSSPARWSPMPASWCSTRRPPMSTAIRSWKSSSALATAAAGPHGDGHRPSPGDHPRRRPHHRAAGRRDHRDRQPRRTDGGRAASTAGSTA